MLKLKGTFQLFLLEAASRIQRLHGLNWPQDECHNGGSHTSSLGVAIFPLHKAMMDNSAFNKMLCKFSHPDKAGASSAAKTLFF